MGFMYQIFYKACQCHHEQIGNKIQQKEAMALESRINSANKNLKYVTVELLSQGSHSANPCKM